MHRRQPVDAVSEERALASVSEAGDRAFSLNAFSAAAGFYESALQLAAAASPERARLLYQLGRTRVLAGDVDPAVLAAACGELLACGDLETAAEAEVSLGELCWLRGDRDEAAEHLGRARDLVKERGPSRAKAYVLSNLSRFLMLGSENPEAIRLGSEALDMATQLGLGELRAHALNNVGTAKVHSGDQTGLKDLERSVEVAVEANAPGEVCRAQFNLAALCWERGELERALSLSEASGLVAKRFGHIWRWKWAQGERATDLYCLGRWDEALARAEELLVEVEAGSPHYLACLCYAIRAQIRLGRDDVVGALADAEKALELARLAKDPQSLYHAMAVCAYIFRDTGHQKRAAELADEFLAWLRPRTDFISAADAFHVFAWTISAFGRGSDFIQALPETDSPWVQAAALFAAGDPGRAADVCAGMGALTEEARDRLFHAETLTQQNRRAEAEVELQRALAFYRSVGATRYIRMGEQLRAESA